MYGIFHIRPVSVGLESQIWHLFIHVTGYLNVRKMSETIDFRTFVGSLFPRNELGSNWTVQWTKVQLFQLDTFKYISYKNSRLVMVWGGIEFNGGGTDSLGHYRTLDVLVAIWRELPFLWSSEDATVVSRQRIHITYNLSGTNVELWPSRPLCRRVRQNQITWRSKTSVGGTSKLESLHFIAL